MRSYATRVATQFVKGTVSAMTGDKGMNKVLLADCPLYGHG